MGETPDFSYDLSKSASYVEFARNTRASLLDAPLSPRSMPRDAFLAHGDRQPTSRPERGSAPFARWDGCLCSGYDAFQPSLSVSYIDLGRSEACRTVTGERRNALLSVEQMCGLLSVHRRLRHLRYCPSRFSGDVFENSATEKMIKTAKNRDFKEK